MRVVVNDAPRSSRHEDSVRSKFIREHVVIHVTSMTCEEFSPCNPRRLKQEAVGFRFTQSKEMRQRNTELTIKRQHCTKKQ